MSPAEARARVLGCVLGVHHRNGGSLAEIDPALRLMEPILLLDSLDLAEIMASIERDFGVSPFERGAPRTWEDVLRLVASRPGG